MGAQEAVVRKENQVLLVIPGIKDKLAHRALKETQDHQGLLVPKENRVSKDSQASQDHRVHQVPLENLEGKGSQDSKVKEATMVSKDLRDHLEPQADQAPQD